MRRTRKSDDDELLASPIAFRACSNGEFCPTPKSSRDRLADTLFRRSVEDNHRRTGLSRRAFAESACGAAAALLVMNQVYGCARSNDGSGGAQAGAGNVYDVDPNLLLDPAQACESLAGNEFIMDVQTHPASPLTPWRDTPLPATAEDFIKALFVDSDTSVACLSGIPAARDFNMDNVAANALLQEMVDKLGRRRLIFHANVDPLRGPAELDYMEQLATTHQLAAWKVYPHVGPWRLDDQTSGLPFLDKARSLGVKIVAAHRGIANDSGLYDAPSSPVDLVQAAVQYPDIQFLTYHSGWQNNVDENHAFDANNPNPAGVDRLIKGLLDNGLGKSGNVYAELGSTWRNLMTKPLDAAHVMGKLLKYLGEDRIVWGTDSVFTGSPQEQIIAFRAFQIPQQIAEMYGYPLLTPAIKAKILGLNGAGVYGIDPAALRCAIKDDFVERLKLARLDDRESVPIPTEKNYGPRDRREFLRFLAWERG